MIVRTYNTSLVQEIMSNTILLDRSGANDASVFDPYSQEDIYYLIPCVDKEVLGLIVCHKLDTYKYQGHVNYLPRYLGKDLYKYTAEAIEWMFSNTECEKILALCPDVYPEVVAHCEASGMMKEGYIVNSTRINNELTNETLMGISKWQ